jgi:segregation and condensation protein B
MTQEIQDNPSQNNSPQSQKSPNPSNGNGQLDESSLKRVIEALIFASEKALSVQQIKDIVGDIDTRVIRRLINELMQEYKGSERSFGITEIAGGFQFNTDPAYSRWLKKLYNIKQSDYLTGPSLETLAIIAYRQPVTKADIEFIRGVNVDGVISNLLDKGLIKTAGRKEVVGRPFLYATTNNFLQYFGLNSLEELPALKEFKETDLDFGTKGKVKVVNEPAQDTMVNDGGEDNGETKEITQENRPD